MKIGTVVSIFDQQWRERFLPLLDQQFDYFEVLPENSAVYTVDELVRFFQKREIILHAPFIETNLIARAPQFQVAAREFLLQELQPLIKSFHPQVITTHAGAYPFIYPEVNLEEFKKLVKAIPACTIENMPGSNNIWRNSYPATEAECDQALAELGCPMTFDVGHFLKQDLDVYRLLEKYLPRIRDIHIHDIVEGEDHRELGTGEFDVERFVGILHKNQYQHYLSIELHHDNVDGMIRSLHLLKKLVK